MPRLRVGMHAAKHSIGMAEVGCVQAAKVNREKGLSARGSKLAVAGSAEGARPRPASLYMDTFSADIVRDAGPPVLHSNAAGSRIHVPLSAAATAAVRSLLLRCQRDAQSVAHRFCQLHACQPLNFAAALMQYRTSRMEAISNKKMAVDSNLSLEQELL